MGEMMAFLLYRQTDVTGVSGTGVIAEGVKFGDGTVAVRWRPLHEGHASSTAIWPSIDDMMKVHGHDGATTIEWIDYPIGGKVWKTSVEKG